MVGCSVQRCICTIHTHAPHHRHLTITITITLTLSTANQILREVGVSDFEAVNVLEADAIRSGMKAYSAWPTFPQVYIDGEFFGGCDIMIGACGCMMGLYMAVVAVMI